MFLLLFYYSCPNFPPLSSCNQPTPQHPQSIPTLFPMSILNKYQIFLLYFFHMYQKSLLHEGKDFGGLQQKPIDCYL